MIKHFKWSDESRIWVYNWLRWQVACGQKKNPYLYIYNMPGNISNIQTITVENVNGEVEKKRKVKIIFFVEKSSLDKTYSQN